MVYRKRESVISHILSDNEVSELLRLRREGYLIKDLAKKFGVHRNTITNIINRDKTRQR